MKLIVGLGNPGSKYANTRHNVGFLVVTQLAKEHGIKVRGNLGPAIYGQGEIAGQSVILLQPTTFMNDSGRAVAYACRRSQVDLDDILIIYDDLDLPLGRIRLRAKGSSGGHKGLRSIITALGTQDIGRLRIGIGRPQGQDVVDYVLSPFSAEEMPTLEQAVARAGDAVVAWVEQGIMQAAAQYNSCKTC